MISMEIKKVKASSSFHCNHYHILRVIIRMYVGTYSYRLYIAYICTYFAIYVAMYVHGNVETHFYQ